MPFNIDNLELWIYPQIYKSSCEIDVGKWRLVNCCTFNLEQNFRFHLQNTFRLMSRRVLWNSVRGLMMVFRWESCLWQKFLMYSRTLNMRPAGKWISTSCFNRIFAELICVLVTIIHDYWFHCSLILLVIQVDLRHIDELNGTNIVEVGVDLSEFYTSVEWDILEVPAVRYISRISLITFA